jgi:site-specific recombinase XerD
VTIRECIDDFLIEQQVRGNSPKTQKHYFRCLGLFERFQSPKNPDISAVSVSDCKAYYIHLSNRNVSSVTVQTYIRALRAFLSWCYLEGYISENIPKKFRLPKAQKKKIDILTDSEVEQLFRCLSGRDFISVRNYCIVALMIDSGLRLNEVVTIRRDKIHIAEGYAIVNGKGNKERFVPLGLNSKRALLRYCAIVPNKEKETPLFVKDTLIPIKESTVKQLFRKLKSRSGIPRLHPHLLRHTFATRYIERGGDIYSLQSILGHTSLEMVKKYVHLIPSKTVVNFAVLSPLDNALKK